MKKALLIAAALMFVSMPLYAFAPYAALFGDTLQSYYDDPLDPETGHFSGGGFTHSLCGVFVAAPYQSIEMWVWWLPDADGMTACEFRITYPTSTYILQGAVYSNPINQVELGTLPAGVSVSLGGANCQMWWYWTHWQEIVVKTMTARTISIVGHPGNGGHIYMADCTPGFPFFDCTVLNHLTLNGNCVYGTHDSSWGAIKNLYN